MKLEEVKTLGEILLAEFGLKEQGWVIWFDNARRRLGQCRYSKKEIGISKGYAELNDEARIKNTILHEIAHALVGSKHGHDQVWRLKALEIGCDGNRVCNEILAMPPKPYTGACPNCGKSSQYHRRKRVACGICCNQFNNGKFTETYLLVFTKN